jgi:hypothetical protein
MSDDLEMFNYSVVIECRKQLVTVEDELDEFIVRLMYDPSDDDNDVGSKPRKVGELHAYVARRFRGCSMYDACDANSQELHDAWSSLYTLRQFVKKGVSLQSEELRDGSPDECDGGFMFVQLVRVSHKHRRKRLGLRMIERLLEVVGCDLSAVVLEACPFNANDMPKKKADAGRVALARYYAEMGFRPFRGQFMVLDLPLG